MRNRIGPLLVVRPAHALALQAHGAHRAQGGRRAGPGGAAGRVARIHRPFTRSPGGSTFPCPATRFAPTARKSRHGLAAPRHAFAFTSHSRTLALIMRSRPLAPASCSRVLTSAGNSCPLALAAVARPMGSARRACSTVPNFGASEMRQGGATMPVRSAWGTKRSTGIVAPTAAMNSIEPQRIPTTLDSRPREMRPVLASTPCARRGNDGPR